MEQRVIDLYDEYTHKPLERRDFLSRLATLAGSVAAANALLPLLESGTAHATIIEEEDERLETRRITYPGASGEMSAYLARPKGAEKLPGVVVIHENRGLNAHIEDVARRAALAGYFAIAPDALSPLGGTPEDTDEARQMIRKLDREKTTQDYVRAVEFLAGHAQSTGKVGCVGFCWGGGMANQMAVRTEKMLAAVAFYGRQASAEDVPKIKGALLLHYGEKDQRINRGIEAYQAALKEAKVDYRLHMYEGANHAFHNDTSSARYDEAAAKLAWDRTIAFFGEKLG